MPTTIKVNGSSNGLIHKGTTHFVKCTAPDVCKTPSPGGPVPIPYPVIISMSSDLANGTTTVKGEGNMVAVKGSEYTRCSGDEAGTAGGVASMVNMKEAKFILFSFDVKMDGKNACRFGDKMTMNHANTFAMGGNEPDQVAPAQYEVGVDCGEKMKPPPDGKGWDKCHCEEVCAMCKGFNESPHPKARLDPSPRARATSSQIPDPTALAAHNANAKAYADGLKQFDKDFTALVNEKGVDHPDVASKFSTKCAYERWKGSQPGYGQGGKVPVSRSRNTAGLNPDHVHDASLGGPLTVDGLKWTNSDVNQTVGPAMSGYDPKQHPGGIKAHPSCGCS